MDLGSPEETLEEMGDLQKEDGSASVEELDLNFAVGKEEKSDDYFSENSSRNDKFQVDPNEQGQLGSPTLPYDFRYVVSESPCQKSRSPDHDDVMKTTFDYDRERSQSPSNNNPYQREMELHGSFFHKNSSPSSIETFHKETGTEDFSHSQEFLLTADANKGEEMENYSDLDRPTSPSHNEKAKKIISENSQSELTKSVYTETEEEATNHQTGKSFSSPTSQLGSDEFKNENFHYLRHSPAESRELEMPHSHQHSLKRTPEQPTLPVTERQMSVSPESSPHINWSSLVHKPSSSGEGAQDQWYQPRSRKHKHSSSPERLDLGKGVHPLHHFSPPARQTSASPRRTQQRAELKDGSSVKHMSGSPKTRYSPPSYGRQDRSRSPIHRRVSSSGYKRDYRDRSRSRSPYTRDYHRRSPRRRYSPRHRSPPSGHHSRHRSPRKRPWSPPHNRSTGIGRPGKNLFVAGFSFLTTERDLERKFSRYGRVRDVRIVRDKRSGDSRGFGFLSLERDEEADAAIRALDKTEWNGRIVLVEKSKSSVR
ncbi:hypothetical protein L1049_000670 [Liquidambar formosana]|uniref:RRM domain-containing protein n=1 Tax=Liquidambar formosana TaxID=63359 RepID=A0AAP0R4Y7_LIQFO